MMPNECKICGKLPMMTREPPVDARFPSAALYTIECCGSRSASCLGDQGFDDVARRWNEGKTLKIDQYETI